VRLVARGAEDGTRLVDLFQRAPLRLMFPGTRAGLIGDAVLVNTAGGIAGGDRLDGAVTALSGASLTVTSQAAERVYRALSEPAQIATRLVVHAGARLGWLPQETIVFNGARLRRRTEIELTPGAELLALESLVLGRADHGEVLREGHVSDGWRVRRDGRLIWADTFMAGEEALPQLRSRPLLGGFRAIATLLYFGADVDARLESLRDAPPSREGRWAVTRVAGLLIARLAAVSAAQMKEGLREILLQFSHETGCPAFRPPKMWSC
jgi:urease accessory protein